MTHSIALFPLSTVLYPGGVLGLRIFEPRYLDMVRDCMRHDREFGVCAVLPDAEREGAVGAAAIGTAARIVDFYTLPDGLLGIKTIGGLRFHVDKAHVRHDGLLMGEVAFWPAEAAQSVPPEYALLATLADHLIEKLGEALPAPNKGDLDNASWVGFRLAEALPFTLQEKQSLLEVRDPLQRLQRIVDALPRFRSEAEQH